MQLFTKVNRLIKMAAAAVVVGTSLLVVPGGAAHAAGMCDAPSPIAARNASGLTRSTNFVLRVGDQISLYPTDSYTNRDQWSSTNPAVATATHPWGEGLITALKEGTTTITYVPYSCTNPTGGPALQTTTVTMTVLPVGCYYLQSRLNNTVITVSGAQMSEGASIITYAQNGGKNQLWTYDALGRLRSDQNVAYGLTLTANAWNAPVVLTHNLAETNLAARWGGPYAGYLRNQAFFNDVLTGGATAAPLVTSPRVMGAGEPSQWWNLVAGSTAECHLDPAQ